jgi:hypothetical protein
VTETVKVTTEGRWPVADEPDIDWLEELGLTPIRFPVDLASVRRIRVVSRRKGRRLARRFERQRTRSCRDRVRRRRRRSNIVFWGLVVVIVAGFVAAPQPEDMPWAQHVGTPPTSVVITPTTTTARVGGG